MADDKLAQTWRARFAACAQSGLSIQKWCALNGTTYRQYGYWKQRLAVLPAPELQEPQWAVVETDEVRPVVAETCLTVRISGAEVDVAPGFDAALLRAIVLALGSPAC